MLEKLKNKKFLLGVLAILVVAIIIPITISQISKTQENRSHASGEAVSIILDPLTKSVNVGDGFDVSVNINGGQNNVSAADITFTYDSALLTATFNPTTTFSTIQNDNQNGTVHYVGVNPTSATVSGSLINIGSFHFVTKANGSATVGFSNIHVNASGVSGALPVDTTNTKVGTYTIGTGGTNTSPTNSPTPSPTTVPITNANGQTTVLLTVNMVGIGSSSSNGLNNNPKTPQRTAQVIFFNAQNQNVLTTSGTLSFDNSSGSYKGVINAGSLATGPYTIKVKLDNTLYKLIPGIQNLIAGSQISASTVTLVAGDLNGDNEINLIDYNLMLACLAHNSTCPAN